MAAIDGAVEAVTRAVLDLEAACVAGRASLPDLLRGALEDAERLCRTHRHRSLVSTRPGSWEAEHLAALFASVEWDDAGRDDD